MANNDKKPKAEPTPKKEAASAAKSTDTPKVADTKAADTPKVADTKAADTPKAADTKAADAPKPADAPKAEADETAGGAPKSYSRGEGQKPVTQAYKDNWNAIFGDKKKKR